MSDIASIDNRRSIRTEGGDEKIVSPIQFKCAVHSHASWLPADTAPKRPIDSDTNQVHCGKFRGPKEKGRQT
jgi:hypothetical protein